MVRPLTGSVEPLLTTTGLPSSSASSWPLVVYSSATIQERSLALLRCPSGANNLESRPLETSHLSSPFCPPVHSSVLLPQLPLPTSWDAASV